MATADEQRRGTVSQPSDPTSSQDGMGGMARLGIGLADWAQRWFPDAFVFALLALVIVFVGGLLAGSSMRDLVKYFGDGFWGLIPFTMQMAMIIVGGYVVVTSPPIYRLIQRLAQVPRTPKGAVAYVAFLAMTTSMISWGFSVIFAGLLAREIVQKVRAIDYRAIGAAAFLGMGTVWALGLSSSASLLMATPSAIPPALMKISGVIPLSQTIYTWQSILVAAVLLCSSTTIAYLSAPSHSTKTAESFGVTEGIAPPKSEVRTTPAEWLEYAPLLSIVVGVVGLAYIGQVIASRGWLAALDLNTYNLMFLMIGLLLHWRPRSFVRAVSNAVPATSGVLIQFPFYAGMFGIVTMTSISVRLAHFFVHISSPSTYPILVSAYSVVLGLLVPSGGTKWVLEAPYVLQAAKDLRVNLGAVVQMYNASEALPNLINPFWMLPLLGILKVKARDLIGFGLLHFVVNSALVFFLMWLLAKTFPFIAPGV